MDLIPSLNPGLHFGVKSEEESFEEPLEGHHVDSSFSCFARIEQKVKCGRVLISTAGQYTMSCNVCSSRFDAMESFTNHLKATHSDYGIRNDGWGKIVIKTESVSKDEEFETPVDTNASVAPNFAAHNISKNIIPKCSATAKKLTLILTAEPIYDEKRLFCVTCNRQFHSKHAFLGHKNYHKEKFHKKEPIHLKNDTQEDVPTELSVKDEFDIGDYGIQDSAEAIIGEGGPLCITCDPKLNSRTTFPRLKCHHRKRLSKQGTTHLNHDFQKDVSTEPRIKDEHGIEVCGNQDSEYDAAIVTALGVGSEMKLCSNNGTNVANEVAEASISQLKLASLDEKISFCRDSNGHYEGEEDLILKSTCDVPIVFSLAPEYDEKKNLCITCNCDFESKQTFRSHKQIHRSKIRKWRIINRVEVKPERVAIVFSENPIFDNREYFCFTCNHKFPSRGSFKYHKYLHKVKIYEKQGIRLGASRMSCEFCTERYRSNTALRQHIVLRHGDAIPTYFKNDPTYLQCRFCHKQFEKPTERYRHEESHSKEEAPYRCSLCPKMFTMSWKREAHQSVHREDHQFQCLQCPKIYKSKVNLNRHIRKTHSGIKPFVCETLGESFDSKSILASNELQSQELGTSCEKIQTETNASVGVDVKFSTHEKTTPTSVELEGATIIEEIPLCEESSSQKEVEKIQEGDFRYSSSFVFTLKPEYDNERNFCISCDLQLDSKQSFKSHKSGHMYQVRRWKLANDLDVSQFRIVLSDDPKFDEEKRFCITCNRGFTSVGSLKFHQRKHKKRILEKQGILPIICEFCSRKFESEESYRRHIVPHHGDKIPTHLKDDITYLKCRFCFKDFEKPTERYRHEQSHANEKTPYRCQFCPKSFIGNWRRKAHQSVHKTDCLFRCLQCPNSYKFKRSLNRHIRITHSGIKSDAGEASGDSFASKSPEASQKLTVYEDDGVETSC